MCAGRAPTTLEGQCRPSSKSSSTRADDLGPEKRRLRIHGIKKRIADPDSTSFLRVRELALRLSIEVWPKKLAIQAVKAAQRPSPATLPPAYPAPASSPSPKRKHVMKLLGRMNERMGHMETRRGRHRRRNDMRCHRCQQPGHFASECKATTTLGSSEFGF